MWTHDKACPDRAIIVLTSAISCIEDTVDNDTKDARILKLWKTMVDIAEADALAIDIIEPSAKAVIKKKTYLLKSEHRAAAGPILSKLNVILV